MPTAARFLAMGSGAVSDVLAGNKADAGVRGIRRPPPPPHQRLRLAPLRATRQGRAHRSFVGADPTDDPAILVPARLLLLGWLCNGGLGWPQAADYVLPPWW